MSVRIILRVWLVIPCRNEGIHAGFSPEEILSVVQIVCIAHQIGGGGGGNWRYVSPG